MKLLILQQLVHVSVCVTIALLLITGDRIPEGEDSMLVRQQASPFIKNTEAELACAAEGFNEEMILQAKESRSSHWQLYAEAQIN